MSKDTQHMWALAGKYSAVGIEMVVSVLMGALGGSWLDRQLGTSPYLLAFGVVVGIGAAVQAVRFILRQSKADHLS